MNKVSLFLVKGIIQQHGHPNSFAFAFYQCRHESDGYSLEVLLMRFVGTMITQRGLN